MDTREKFYLEERQMADYDPSYYPEIDFLEKMKAKKFRQKIKHIIDNASLGGKSNDRTSTIDSK